MCLYLICKIFWSSSCQASPSRLFKICFLYLVGPPNNQGEDLSYKVKLSKIISTSTTFCVLYVADKLSCFSLSCLGPTFNQSAFSIVVGVFCFFEVHASTSVYPKSFTLHSQIPTQGDSNAVPWILLIWNENLKF